MELYTENLTRRFGTKAAVDDVSVAFQPGVYGLLGANGAGKTTLMRMLCGILRPTSGRVLYDGKDIDQLGEKYHVHLGYLPQDFGYYPNFTAHEYLNFIGAVKGLDHSAVIHRIPGLLETVNLLDASQKKIRTFSGGMKQRLGIAQAILNDPRILILDEPTAGLDPRERIRFRSLISELARDRIVILSTHIVSDISYIADRILMMKNGRLILNCSAEDAISSMSGKVWSCTLPQGELAQMSLRFRMANMRHEPHGMISLRIVNDTQPVCGAEHTQPTLEDLYLYYFQDVCGEACEE